MRLAIGASICVRRNGCSVESVAARSTMRIPPPEAAPAAAQDGKQRCRSAEAVTATMCGRRRNTPADHTQKILEEAQRDDPRELAPASFAWPPAPSPPRPGPPPWPPPSSSAAPDDACSAFAAPPSHARSPGSAAAPSNGTTPVPSPCSPRCSTAEDNDPRDTAAHNPSEHTTAGQGDNLGTRCPLDARLLRRKLGRLGPQEVLSLVGSSPGAGASDSAPGRFLTASLSAYGITTVTSPLYTRIDRTRIPVPSQRRICHRQPPASSRPTPSARRFPICPPGPFLASTPLAFLASVEEREG